MYIHILKEKRTKLDPSGKKGIFVGYSKSSKAYIIYFLGFKKIEISRDVTFDEDSAYNKSRKKPAEVCICNVLKSCQVIVGNPPIGQGLKSPQFRGTRVVRLT